MGGGGFRPDWTEPEPALLLLFKLWKGIWSMAWEESVVQHFTTAGSYSELEKEADKRAFIKRAWRYIQPTFRAIKNKLNMTAGTKTYTYFV